jgi:hypothetical protein
MRKENTLKAISGKYASAKVFTDNIEDKATEQILTLCNQSFVDGCKIRIMPDVHAGSGCVIGFTANLGKKVIPNIVGVDIGCGMLVAELGIEHIEPLVLRQSVPQVHDRLKPVLVDLCFCRILLCIRFDAVNDGDTLFWLHKKIGTPYLKM